MMKPILQSHREAVSFESLFIPEHLREAPRAGDLSFGVQMIRPESMRRFHAVADLEAILWLHLGNELGLFTNEDAEQIWQSFREQFNMSLAYVNKLGISSFFPNEVSIFLSELHRTSSISNATYAQRLSTELIDRRGLEMLLHEVGGQFRDGTLTRYIVSGTPLEWGDCFEKEPDPDVILKKSYFLDRGDDLFASYLRFIEHMAAIGEFFRQMADTAESNFSAFEVERRIRAIHNWRLDLHDDNVRERFVHLTATFLRNVNNDDELASLGFDATSLLARIEFLCAEWTGDSLFPMNLPIPGGRRRTANG